MFWLLDAEHSFNGNESRLYFYLLKLSNSLYWKNPLTNADGYTASMVGISVNTLKTCRNRLQQAGLIRFKPGGNGARDKCLYEITDAENIKDKVSKNDTLKEVRYQNLTPNLQPYLQPYPYPYQQNTDDIYKHKPNKTKPNNSDSIESGTDEKNLSDLKTKKERKKSPAEKKKGDVTEHWQELVQTWFEFNTENFNGFKPSFKGQDAKSLKVIVTNLEKRSIAKGIPWSEDAAIDTLRNYLSFAIKDKWLKNNFLLSNLEKQLDKILINGGKQTNSNSVKSAFSKIDSMPD